MFDDKQEPSVWYVAGIAICLYVGVMFIGGILAGPEGVAVAAQ